MFSLSLLRQRLLREFKFHNRIFKMVLDWTVVVYVVIPVSLFLGFNYYQLWHTVPTWINFLSLPTVFGLFYLFSWTGELRIYVEDADQLFLIKHDKEFLQLKVFGILINVFIKTSLLILMLLAILPLLVTYYNLNFTNIMSLLALFFALKILVGSLKIKLREVKYRIVERILQISLIIIGGFSLASIFPVWLAGQDYFVFLVSLLLCALALPIILSYVKSESLFLSQAKVEKSERIRFVKFIYSFTQELEKPRVITRKRPFLWRSSQTIFKKRTSKLSFIEMFIKVFIRNPAHLASYSQIVFITALALHYIDVIWLQILVIIATLFFINAWIKLTFKKIVEVNPQLKKYIDSEGYFEAEQAIAKFLIILIVIIVSILYIWLQMAKAFIESFI